MLSAYSFFFPVTQENLKSSGQWAVLETAEEECEVMCKEKGPSLNLKATGMCGVINGIVAF